MTLLKFILIAVASFFVSVGFAADDHKNEKKGTEVQSTDEKDEHDHAAENKADKKDEDGHAHEEGEKDDEHAGHDDHGEKGEEESSTTIGPDKGIIEKAEAGFKLSPEAIKTINIKTQAITGKNLNFPIRALVQIKDEKSVYRMRNGWIKRVPIQVTKKDGNTFTAQTSSLQDGDQIVTDGTGFLRITEIFAEEGASHSHSH